MPPSTARSPKRNRDRRTLTAEEWKEDERALETTERDLQQLYDALAGREWRPADVEAMMLGAIRFAAKLPEFNPDNDKLNGMASMLLDCYARILGPEVSMQILYDQFGPGILKRSLNKQRGPTSVHGDDYRRIRVCIDAIVWATGSSVRQACKDLGKNEAEAAKG